MRQVIVGKNDAGQRLDKFIVNLFPSMPVSLMYRYLREKRIKRNGGRGKGSDRIEEGDRIELYVNDDLLDGRQEDYAYLLVTPDLQIVYEDANIMIVDKPPGLLVHSDDKESVHTLIAQIHAHLYQTGAYDPAVENSFAPALCNRLDRNTAGLCVAAKNRLALRDLNEIIRTRQLKRFYLAWVEGIPTPSEGRLDGYLLRDEKTATVRILKHRVAGAKTVETHYKTVRTTNERALLEIELVTGRTHQIRAHLAYIGHPIVGDGKYGRVRNAREGHQALCAHRICFALHPYDGILSYLDRKEFFSKQQLPTV